MASFVAVENLAPDAKRSMLSLKLKKKKPADGCKDCFVVVSSKEVEEPKKQIVPKNTSKQTSWAVRLFETWCRQRNEHSVKNWQGARK